MNRALLIPITLIALLTGQPVMAQGSGQHSGQASSQAFAASGHLTAGGAKVASGMAAVPLIAAGAFGALSGHAGEALMDAANAEIGQPLHITDETIIAGPPPSEAIH